MREKSRRYAAEYRRRMIDLVRGGRTPEELSREFEASAQAIRNWVVEADRAEVGLPIRFRRPLLHLVP